MADTMRTTAGSGFGGRSVPVSPGQRQNGEGASRAISDVKEMGTELVAAVRDSANALFEEQRNRAADEIAALGQALRRSAQSLEQDGGAVARYADEAARQMGDFADTLRRRSWNQLTEDLEGAARRWPAVFMAATVGLGFLAGRFLMASSARSVEAGAASSSGVRGNTGIQPAMGRDSGTVAGSISRPGTSGYGAAAPGEND